MKWLVNVFFELFRIGIGQESVSLAGARFQGEVNAAGKSKHWTQTGRTVCERLSL